METALGWIGDFIRWMAQIFPRLALVRITEQAVKFTRGEASVLEPGLHFWWPLVSEVDTYSIVRQVMSLEQQVVQTQEERTVVLDAVVVFSIDDLYVFAVENHDALDNIAELAESGLRKATLSTPWAEILEGRAKFDNRLTSEASKALKGFGVEIETMRLQSCAEGHVLIHTGPTPLGGNYATEE